MSSARPPQSILWYRWPALVALVAAVASVLLAASLELATPGAPGNRRYFVVAGFCVLVSLVVLPLLLFRAIRARGLVRKEWRAVLMRAVWGGPFGTLGALWDLTAEPGEARKEAR